MKYKFEKGDRVIPNGLRLFGDAGVSKVIDTIGDYNGQEIIKFEGRDKFYKASDYQKNEVEQLRREEALANCIYLFDEDVEENGYDESIHISSKTGEPKVDIPDAVAALFSAFHMSVRHGGKWVYYKCPICGNFHVGKQNEENEA